MSMLTGYKDLDRRLENGFCNGYLYVLAGRPAMGKTGLIINILDHICNREKRCVLMFSLDSPRRAIIDRMLSHRSGVECSKIRKVTLEEKEWDALIEAAGVIKKSNLLIDDTQIMDIEELKRRCRYYREKNKDLSMIVIDYLQLISGVDKHEPDEYEISNIMAELKSLAEEMELPILVLSILTRDCEKREDHWPRLSDLPGGRAVEEYADVVMFLYRDDYYDRFSESKGTAQIVFAKNPEGSRSSCMLRYSDNLCRFEDYM